MAQNEEKERRGEGEKDDAVAQSLDLIESTSASYCPRGRPHTSLAVATANDVDEMAIVGCDVALDPDDRQPATVARRVAGGLSGRDSFRTAASHVDRALQSINHK